MSSNREARVLAWSSAKNKSKPVEPPVAEAQTSSKEIHVTESKAEILREDEINTPTIIVKKRRRLVLSDSSSSSSHHSTPAPQKEVSSSRRPARKKDKEPPIYYVRTPHTRPKKKIHYSFKMMNNPRFKDHIINVDKSPPEKKEKKQVSKIREKSLKQMKAKKMDGLELLSVALDSLN